MASYLRVQLCPNGKVSILILEPNQCGYDSPLWNSWGKTGQLPDLPVIRAMASCNQSIETHYVIVISLSVTIIIIIIIIITISIVLISLILTILRFLLLVSSNHQYYLYLKWVVELFLNWTFISGFTTLTLFPKY